MKLHIAVPIKLLPGGRNGLARNRTASRSHERTSPRQASPVRRSAQVCGRRPHENRGRTGQDTADQREDEDASDQVTEPAGLRGRNRAGSGSSRHAASSASVNAAGNVLTGRTRPATPPATTTNIAQQHRPPPARRQPPVREEQHGKNTSSLVSAAVVPRGPSACPRPRSRTGGPRPAVGILLGQHGDRQRQPEQAEQPADPARWSARPVRPAVGDALGREARPAQHAVGNDRRPSRSWLPIESRTALTSSAQPISG